MVPEFYQNWIYRKVTDNAPKILVRGMVRGGLVNVRRCFDLSEMKIG